MGTIDGNWNSYGSTGSVAVTWIGGSTPSITFTITTSEASGLVTVNLNGTVSTDNWVVKVRRSPYLHINGNFSPA